MLWGLIKPKDWKIIFKAESNYKIQKLYEISALNKIPIGDVYEKKSYTILKYSKSRNKYKILFLGWVPSNPKLDNGYQKCIEKQIELQNKLN